MAIPVKCTLCGSGNIKIITRHLTGNSKGNDFSPTASDFGIFYPLARCKECGIIFSVLDDKDAEIRQACAESKDDTYLSQSAQRILTFKTILAHIERFIPESGRLLDIGCSYGLFLQTAKEAGLQVSGIEISKDACRHCAETLGLDVYCGEIRQAAFPENYFDAITAIEVIEHVNNPGELISDIYRRLKPGGILYLVTPDVKSLSGKALGRRWWSYRRMHLCYFSKKTLCGFLRKNNFSIISATPYKKTFKAEYILRHLLEMDCMRPFRPFLTRLTGISRISNLLIRASFGDIAITAKKQ